MTPYQVKLINDRELLVTLEVDPRQAILDAVEAQGISLPSNLCREGNCLYCIGRIVSGDIEQVAQDGLAETLCASYVLLCMASPNSDCTIMTRLLG